jgi:diphosphomevalonate decarboxylase
MSAQPSVKAVASPNIAFIKYWGNWDHALRIPSNPSLSMTLGGLETETTVTLLPLGSEDSLTLNGEPQTGPALERVSSFLSIVRALARRDEAAAVWSKNDYPSGAGIASSAAAFSALALAASRAYSLDLSATELSLLARRGSGSAARSIFGGFVEMNTGKSDAEAFATPFLPKDHWPLHDLIAVIDRGHKVTGSSQGHLLAETSPIQEARVQDTRRRMELCREALRQRDFASFAEIVEQDSNLMHAVMMTSNPSLLYLQPGSLAVIQNVRAWRREGIEVCYTVDAGPNVHVVCTAKHVKEVQRRLIAIDDVQTIIHAEPGPAARLIDAETA